MRSMNLRLLDFRAAVAGVNDHDRTVDVTWTTGAGVLRRDASGVYLEVLSLDPKHVRLGRLNNGAPVLNSHESYSIDRILGVVVEGSARIAGPAEGRARLRFSRRADVEPYFQDIRDGIIKNCSVGYRVHRFQESRGQDGGVVLTAIDWEPYEISLVSIGADPGATLRGEAGELNHCEIVAAAADVAPVAAESRQSRLFDDACAPHLRGLSDDQVFAVWEDLRSEYSGKGDSEMADMLSRVIADARVRVGDGLVA
jgi:hypothetical protein